MTNSGSAPPETAPGADPTIDAKVFAVYLPQYHRTPENDTWWGEGFTDWTNVRKARALFPGHDQPRVPKQLGYYDLTDPGIHYEQAALAKSFGIGGFCYYAYWFGGRRILERPLDVVLTRPDIDMPYMLCWANEPWSRRWDGSESELLIPQPHDPDRDAQFVDDIAPHLADGRYIRAEGKPFLLIYRVGLLQDPLRTTDLIRERAVKLGLGELYLAMVQTFGHWEPVSYGFDAAVEFPPHNLTVDPTAARWRDPEKLKTNGVWTASFDDVIRVSLSRSVPLFPWFRGVMPGWDNTPRRGQRGTVYVGADPGKFERWLEAALECTYLFQPPGRRFVFVNAWNEWAEGAHLEPDERSGEAYLEAVRLALARTRPLATGTAGQAPRLPASDAIDLVTLARSPWIGRREWLPERAPDR